MTTNAVTAERFAKGMTFDQYVTHAGSAENLAREAWGGYVPDSGSFGAPRKDNSASARGTREFAAMQASPFFDVWASAAVDEILRVLYERVTVSDR